MAFYGAPKKVNTSTQEPIGPSGPPKGKDKFANGAAPYGMSPYVTSKGKPIPWGDASMTQPLYTPDAGMPQNQSYFAADRNGPGSQWETDQKANVARGKQAIMGDPEAAADLASGDWKAMTKRMQQIGQRGQAQKFVDMGGGNSMDMWNNRFNTAWPTPTMANGQRAAGAPTSAGGPGAPPASPMQAPPPGGSNANTIGSALAKIQGGMQGPGGLSNMPGGMGDIQGKLMQSIQGTMQGGPGSQGTGGSSMITGYDPGPSSPPNQMQALPPQPPASTGSNEAAPPPQGMNPAWTAQGKGDMMTKINANRAAHGMPPI